MVRWNPIRVLSTCLVVVLVLLALQQWRWVRQIEGHEHSGQDRRVGYATWVFKSMFDREMGALLRWTAAPSGPGEDAIGDLAGRVRAWPMSIRPGVSAVHVPTVVDFGNA